jgi:DNA-binding CsgD family transcriptional regulator
MPPIRRLAPREQQIIDLISRGQTDKAIAAELSLSVRTVRTHLERLYRKQYLHSRAEAVAFSTSPCPNSVAVGDFNGDGKSDLAVVNANSNEVSIMLGNGDGTFQPAASYGTGSPPVAIAVGDFNGDGMPDLAVVNANSIDILIMLGNGDGTFQEPISCGVEDAPRSVSARS